MARRLESTATAPPWFISQLFSDGYLLSDMEAMYAQVADELEQTTGPARELVAFMAPARPANANGGRWPARG